MRIFKISLFFKYPSKIDGFTWRLQKPPISNSKIIVAQSSSDERRFLFLSFHFMVMRVQNHSFFSFFISLGSSSAHHTRGRRTCRRRQDRSCEASLLARGEDAPAPAQLSLSEESRTRRHAHQRSEEMGARCSSTKELTRSQLTSHGTQICTSKHRSS
jgi:hypothetical protein